MSTTSTVLVVEQSTPARSERFEIGRHRTSVRDTESNRAQVPVYSRFSNAEKRGITALLAFCGVLATMSTTSILAAIRETDAFEIPLEDFKKSAAVNIFSAYTAAQEAVKDWKELLPSSSPTFIYSGTART
ncbi:uncharacterized protein BKA55DRAFT_681858 [Fusarium redolens]|jgi:hypothetical protein|uniref:Uncharacterized protein n=1 Tax=Fusarium redolens TaxID=48865 RepID=A0A9P9JK26_FUSRE|nr:uncharacterized protein BKA55DRAFT_681858 [Fusarium redolens]KAH7205384.1 hypothetical protein BKA55DRAFT_681858 [Fusarium redolens]